MLKEVLQLKPKDTNKQEENPKKLLARAAMQIQMALVNMEHTPFTFSEWRLKCSLATLKC